MQSPHFSVGLRVQGFKKMGLWVKVGHRLLNLCDFDSSSSSSGSGGGGGGSGSSGSGSSRYYLGGINALLL